jgi:2-aminoadipate transaminase
LLPEAVAAKVAYVPGSAFYPEASRGAHTMRLNFSNAQQAQIEEGIRRLGELLKRKISRYRRTETVRSLSKE